jgi:Zn-dependent protease
MDQTKLYHLLLFILPLFFSLSFHEAAHAWMAKRRGDDTAYQLGRLSLNPMVHVDLFGTILLPAFMMWVGGPLFGWAKPVPVNPLNLKHYRRDNLFISLAGPVSNVLLALIFSAGFRLFALSAGLFQGLEARGVIFIEPVSLMLYYAVALNLGLALFNILPLPALDGSHVLAGLLPERWARKIDEYQAYSFIIFILLLYSGVLKYLWIPVQMCMAVLIGS